MPGFLPGIWHSVACLAHGALSYEVGDDELAEQMLAEAAAEAEVHGAVTTVAVSRAHLAVLHGEAGDPARAAALVRSARALVEQNRLEQNPTMVLVTAMAAHVEAVEGNPDRAGDEWLLARRSLTQHARGGSAGRTSSPASRSPAPASSSRIDRPPAP